MNIMCPLLMGGNRHRQRSPRHPEPSEVVGVDPARARKRSLVGSLYQDPPVGVPCLEA